MLGWPHGGTGWYQQRDLADHVKCIASRLSAVLEPRVGPLTLTMLSAGVTGTAMNVFWSLAEVSQVGGAFHIMF